MNDPSSLSFALTYAGTLGVAGLMLLGQLVAFTALLVLAGAEPLHPRKPDNRAAFQLASRRDSPVSAIPCATVCGAGLYKGMGGHGFPDGVFHCIGQICRFSSWGAPIGAKTGRGACKNGGHARA